jgi:hypothetical protein
MTQEEEFLRLKIEVANNGKILIDLHEQSRNILEALKGNSISGDGGLIKQLHEMDKNQQDFEVNIENKIKHLESEFQKQVAVLAEEVSKLKNIILKWKYIAVGLLFAGGLIGYLIKYIFEYQVKK